MTTGRKEFVSFNALKAESTASATGKKDKGIYRLQGTTRRSTSVVVVDSRRRSEAGTCTTTTPPPSADQRKGA